MFLGQDLPPAAAPFGGGDKYCATLIKYELSVMDFTIFHYIILQSSNKRNRLINFYLKDREE